MEIYVTKNKYAFIYNNYPKTTIYFIILISRIFSEKSQHFDLHENLFKSYGRKVDKC